MHAPLQLLSFTSGVAFFAAIIISLSVLSSCRQLESDWIVICMWLREADTPFVPFRSHAVVVASILALALFKRLIHRNWMLHFLGAPLCLSSSLLHLLM